MAKCPSGISPMVEPTETQHASRESELETRDGSLDVSTFRDSEPKLSAQDDPHVRADAIGRYLVLDRLGAGAMGVVYAAYDPELDRKVALKLIKSVRSAKSDAANARLLREAQALAKLDHPNVVPVHDAGDHDGQVFVTMKFVEGQTLDEWLAREPPPPLDEILRVFLDAGRGLVAAHAQGLVHRDFKPENVMLESNGGVRVMDFGLVRQREDEDETRSIESDPFPSDLRLTRTGALLGTPAYMAPELFSGGEATVLSDQYAFCVSLYEALYAERPFGGDNLGALVLQASEGRIRDAPNGSRVPTWLRRTLVRGLSPEPEARWPDMAALLAALADDPVARRRRVLLVGGGLATLGALMVVTVMGLRGASTKCRDASVPVEAVWNDAVRAQIDQRVEASPLSFASASWARNRPRIDAWAREWVDARRDACEDTHLRGEQSSELLDLRMSCLDEKLRELRASAQVLTQADDGTLKALSKIAGGLPDLGPCADADYLRAEARPPSDPAEVARVAEIDELIASSTALGRAARSGEADTAAEHAWKLANESTHGPTRVRARLMLSTRQRAQGHYEASLESSREAYYEALKLRLHQAAGRAARATVFTLGYYMDHYDEAIEWGRRASANFGGEPDARLESNLGVVLLRKGDYASARPHLERALELYTASDGPDSYQAASVHMNLSALASSEGKNDEAITHVEATLRGYAEYYGPEHPEVGLAHLNRGGTLAGLGKLDEAIEATRLARDILEATRGPDHSEVALAYMNLGLMAYMQDRHDEALQHTQRALDIKRKVHGDDASEVADLWVNMGAIYHALGRHQDSREAAEESLRIAEKVHGPEHQKVASALNNLALAVIEEGRLEEAIELNERALRIRTATLGENHPMTAESLRSTCANYLQLGRLERAQELAQRGLASSLAAHGDAHASYGEALALTARVHARRGERAAGREAFDHALKVLETAKSDTDPRLATLLLRFAALERGDGRLEAARELARRGITIADANQVELEAELEATAEWARAQSTP